MASAPDSALDALDTQWDRLSPNEQRRSAFEYYLARAEVHLNALRITDCMADCDSAMRYRRHGQVADEAAIDFLKGKAFFEVGDYPMAYRLFESACGVFSATNDPVRTADCHNEIGWVHYVQEQYALAERRWRTMLAISRSIEDRRLEAIALRRVGLACLYLYDPDDIGLAYYDSALHTSRLLGDPYELAGIHSNIGKHMDSAIYYAKLSGDQARLYSIMHTAGTSLLHKGDASGAVELCEQALSFAVSVKNPMLERDAAQCLCSAYGMMHRWKEAFRAQERWRGINDRIISSRAKDEMAMRAVGREFEVRAHEDSIVHLAELAKLENARMTEGLRADRNQSRMVAIGAGGALLLGVGLLFLSVDRKRRRERHERDTARLQNQVLRTQMNPHFIFNALNSINNYVQENERDLASSFLSRFARLMRLVLESSRHDEVSLAEDLEALRLYMELEQARMNGKFDFSIDIDPAIDQTETVVPPLVMQPFVENAIWHGISRKEGKGHIKLIVRQGLNRLSMIVEDDGVGRGASSMHPAPDGAPPKSSLGTTIARDRLALFGRQRSGEAGFNFIDLDQGTRIEIVLPTTSILPPVPPQRTTAR